jgi:regulatory protein
MKKSAADKRPLTAAEKRKRTFDRAVKLISAKSRSVAELRERLLQGRNSSKVDVEAVISRLKEYGYLDDERFAFSYASLRIKQRPIGRRRFRARPQVQKNRQRSFR